MRKRISQQLVQSLKPTSQPIEIRDTQTKGFLIRQQPPSSLYPTGSISYVVRYARNRRITLGKVGMLTPMRARNLAIMVLGLARDGATDAEIRQAIRPGVGVTLEGFIDDVYGPWAVAERKSGQGTVERLRAVFYPDFGRKRLIDISQWSIEQWRKRRKQNGIKAATTNRELNSLKAALTKAAEWGVIDKSPITSVKLDRIDKHPKTRHLSPEERQRLDAVLATKSGHIAPIVLLALNTGMRRGEIFNLHWRDIDLDRNLLTVGGGGAKSGQTLIVPLNVEAREALTNWQRQGSGEGRVFPGRGGGRLNKVDKVWHTVLKEAKITEFRFHDLRHTYASDLVDEGAEVNSGRLQPAQT